MISSSRTNNKDSRSKWSWSELKQLFLTITVGLILIQKQLVAKSSARRSRLTTRGDGVGEESQLPCQKDQRLITIGTLSRSGTGTGTGTMTMEDATSGHHPHHPHHAHHHRRTPNTPREHDIQVPVNIIKVSNLYGIKVQITNFPS